MSKRTIIIWYEHPSIPTRIHDWGAHYEGMEEDGPYGWGITPEAALHDLIFNSEDEDDV